MLDKKVLKGLKSKYYQAKATNEIKKEIDRKVRNEVLKENEFMYAPEWQPDMTGRITDCDEDYLMTEEDTERFITLIHEKWLKYDKEHQRNETTWKYKKAVIDAEEEIFKYAIQELPKERPELTEEAITRIKNNMKYRENFIKLTLQYAN